MNVTGMLCVSLLLLAGCALQKGQWVRPGMTEAQWKLDHYECTRDATYQSIWVPFPFDCCHGPGGWPRHVESVPRLNRGLYNMCLESRGYQWQPEQQE